MSDLIVNTSEGIIQITQIQFGVLSSSDISKLSTIECVNRDNINILSNVVDTLFIDSNTYDENTLKDISKALHDTNKIK